MSLFKFNVRLFNAFTGEIVGEFETYPLGLPDDSEKIVNYMRAYVRKLNNEPLSELSMTITSERMLNSRVRDGRYKEGDIF